MYSLFSNDTATPRSYPLSLHDALPIYPFGDTLTITSVDRFAQNGKVSLGADGKITFTPRADYNGQAGRSEEHTSEHQSLRHLVCRLLLEKKKKPNRDNIEYAHVQVTAV